MSSPKTKRFSFNHTLSSFRMPPRESNGFGELKKSTSLLDSDVNEMLKKLREDLSNSDIASLSKSQSIC